MNVYVFLPARDEEKNLPACLDALVNQTLKPFKILVINDASIDRTREIADSYGIDVVNLTERHESYSSPERGWMLAFVWNHAFPVPPTTDYIMQTGADIILPLNYVEKLVGLMEQNKKLVIASGTIKNEHSSSVRGVGRLYKAWFWNKYIVNFPLIYTTESYPLYKALSLGLHVQSFPELVMQSQRPTTLYEAKYGYGMRELGYFSLYALARCLLASLFSRKRGVMMLKTYLLAPFRLKDKAVSNYIRLHQARTILYEAQTNLYMKRWLKLWILRSVN